MLEFAAVFLPGLAALITGVFGRTLGDRGAQVVTCSAVIFAAFISLILFISVGLFGDGDAQTASDNVVTLFTFIDIGDLQVDWALRVDTLTAVMFVVVNGVSALVHVYSVGYMSHDPSQPRFMAYLSLFTFAMLILVSADNLVQMFVGWEGVGLASYLLIGFWHHKHSANAASMKAFIVNRVGDFGFVLGIAAVFAIFGTVEFSTLLDPQVIATQAELRIDFFGYEVHALTLAALLLFMGAMGKSAQLGLHTWLPDAMEGPTPVSALIHAATMVTAGVFMLCRLSPLFEFSPTTLEVVTVVGALTAFVAATIGMTQHDIKRIIAYSTMSQLGYMFFAIGVSAYSAAMFHLTTHAFFKALLFLGAGSVIHALDGEQDIRRMGGMKRAIRWTFLAMMVGSIALAGLPPLAGFYSKDAILGAAWTASIPVVEGFTITPFGGFAYVLGLAAAAMTAFYSFRLIFLVFYGDNRSGPQVFHHAHESPKVMLVPLAVLAGLAILSGLLLEGLMIGHWAPGFWGSSLFVLPENDVIGLIHGHSTLPAAVDYIAHHDGEGYHVPFLIHYGGVILAIGGIALAWLLFLKRPGAPAAISEQLGALYDFVHRKWYFDEIYDALFVRPAPRLGWLLWRRGDRGTIDAIGPDGAAAMTWLASLRARALQSGYVYHYALATVLGLVGLVTYTLLRFQS